MIWLQECLCEEDDRPRKVLVNSIALGFRASGFGFE